MGKIRVLVGGKGSCKKFHIRGCQRTAIDREERRDARRNRTARAAVSQFPEFPGGTIGIVEIKIGTAGSIVPTLRNPRRVGQPFVSTLLKKGWAGPVLPLPSLVTFPAGA